MQRSHDLGLVYGPYGGVGYCERDGARKSADFFAWWRSLIIKLLT